MAVSLANEVHPAMKKVVALPVRVISLVAVLFLCAISAAASPQKKKTPEPSPDGACPQQSTVDNEETFSDFVIRIYRGRNESFEGCIEVLRNNRIVFSRRTEGKVVIGNDVNKGSRSKAAEPGEYHPPAISVGTDITGLGKPNLILNEWSGGAHCCFSFHVLELGDRPREIAVVDAADSDYAHFEDVNHDGHYEFVGWDFTFAYWRTGFSQSPAPRILLRFDGMKYELAPDLMRQAPPATKELSLIEANVLNDDWEEGTPPPLLWRTMLDLIYTGHSDLAWKFFDAAWSPQHIGKAAFLQDFCSKLATSPYFSKLRATIPAAPCKLNPNSGNDAR